MPQHKSCKKRIRTSKKQNLYNRAIKSSVKTTLKKFDVAEGEDSPLAFRAAASALDLAARKGVIPKKRADRKKSRLAKALNRNAAATQ